MADRMPEGELGYTGLQQYHGLVQEHWVKSLSTHPKRIKMYDEIYRYDPTASAMVKITSMFMCNAEPRVETASTSATDMAAAEFLESCLFDMTKDWYDIMSDIVLFMVYGFFDQEIVYWRRDGKKSKFADGRIGWRKWAPRHPVTLDEWTFDENGGLQAMVQMCPSTYKTATIPIEKLLHFTTTGMGKNNPEGASILEGAYASWFYAKNLTIQEAVVIERMSGTPAMKLPEGASTDDSSTSDLSRGKRVVRNVKVAEDMGLTLPHGFEFEYVMPKSGPAINPGEVIMRHRRDIARNLAMDFIMLGGGDQGSWAMHADKSSLYIRSISSFLRKIASIINRHGVTRLFALNAFPGTTGLPIVYFTPITKIDIGGFATVIANLFNSGAVTWDMGTENAVRREVGLPEITEPGVFYKPPQIMPTPEEPQQSSAGQGPEDKEPEDESGGDRTDTGEEFQFAEQARMRRPEAVALTDEIAEELALAYDKWADELAQDLAEAKEKDWSEIMDAALLFLGLLILTRLRRGMLEAWERTTDNDPSTEGLESILRELSLQLGFIREKLIPAIRLKILDLRRSLAREAARGEIIVSALHSALGMFSYRVTTYAGGVYKLWANAASSWAIRLAMTPAAKRASVVIRRNPNTGLLSGPGILLRYVGFDDRRTCDGCRVILRAGWQRSVPPVGSQECGSNDRCCIEYKFKGRIYRLT